MKYNDFNEDAPKRKFSDPFEEISSRSQDIKASIKRKYTIHRLQRFFFSRQSL